VNFSGAFLGQKQVLKWATTAEIDSFGVDLRIVTGHLVSRDKNFILLQLLTSQALTSILRKNIFCRFSAFFSVFWAMLVKSLEKLAGFDYLFLDKFVRQPRFE